MAKKRWKRDPVTGLPKKRIEFLPDSYLDREGNFDTTPLPNCNIWNVSSMAAIARFTPAHFESEVITNPGSFFHMHIVRDEFGRRVTFASNVSSVYYGADKYREAMTHRRIETLKRNIRPTPVNI